MLKKKALENDTPHAPNPSTPSPNPPPLQFSFARQLTHMDTNRDYSNQQNRLMLTVLISDTSHEGSLRFPVDSCVPGFQLQ